MLISDEYKIEAPEYLNVTLFKKRVIKEGKNKDKEVWDAIAYTPNVKVALQTLVTREINGTGLNDLETVVAKVEELMEQIDIIAKNIDYSLKEKNKEKSEEEIYE